MADYEMPVIVRLTQHELAATLNKPLDHPDVKALGGLNIVIHPAESEHSRASADAVAAKVGSDAMAQIKAQLLPLEQKVFHALRNPKIAKDFLRDPLGTLERLGLIDAKKRGELQQLQQTVTAAVAPKA